MARVTVEDCVNVIPNRYELVLLAAQRARDIAAGAMLTVDRDNDKNAVIALREIAEQTIDLQELKNHIAKGVNRHQDLNFEDDALLALEEATLPNFEDTSAPTEIEEVAFDDGEAEGEEAQPAEEVGEPDQEALKQMEAEAKEVEDLETGADLDDLDSDSNTSEDEGTRQSASAT